LIIHQARAIFSETFTLDSSGILKIMENSGYMYYSAGASHTHAYLWKPSLAVLATALTASTPRRIFDLGCGSGAFAGVLAAQGYAVSGVDPSTSGIASARQAFPKLQLEVGSTEEDLAARFGKFPAVTSLEVVEHVYAPREFARRVYDLLLPGGVAVISTPYNGYLKNLAIALLNGHDRHHSPLWDHGHIKFWSVRTLGRLLSEAGFEELKFLRVGRIPALAKSMIAIAKKPL
jgi:2-polyprenyl-3-methyl-5-hydroxy-6-metoxy-1,4-benzoquinol methylase